MPTRRQFLQTTGASAMLSACGGAQRPAPFGDLAQRMAGRVVPRGDQGYEALRPLFNRRFDGAFPQVIVLPADAADVQVAMAWATRRGIPLHPRGGGHSYLGNSTGSGMVLDLRALSRVHVAGEQVHVAGGARLLDVATSAGASGLALPLGSCPTVGVGGYALGGGIGLSSRYLGLLSDRLVGADMVTVGGEFVRTEDHPDLLWGLRGGGGGLLGVVTELRFRGQPVGDVSWFSARIAWSDAANAFLRWQAFSPVTDRRLTSVFRVTHRGASCAGQFYGDSQQLKKLIAPLRLDASFASGPVQTAARVWADCERGPLAACHQVERDAYEAAGLLFSGSLRRQTVERVVEKVRTGGTVSVLFDAWGGAMSEVAEGATAFAHRDVRFSAQLVNRESGRWLAETRAILAPHASERIYANYAHQATAHWERKHHGQNLERLRALKHTWDPTNRLRGKQLVRPVAKVAVARAVRELASGFRFAEGPAADRDGNVYFTDIPNNRIHRYAVDGTLTTVASDTGAANGLYFDRDGRLVACEGGRRQVTRNGAVLASHYDGKRLNSPNDVWIAGNGDIYFTDPRYGNQAGLELGGFHVYCIRVSGRLERVLTDLVKPNGIIGDDTHLWVADHGASTVYRYHIAKNTLEDRQLFAHVASDGMTLDSRGRLYTTGDGIHVFRHDGVLEEHVAIPQRVTNVTFGGPKRDTLFVTAGSSLYAVDGLTSN